MDKVKGSKNRVLAKVSATVEEFGAIKERNLVFCTGIVGKMP